MLNNSVFSLCLKVLSSSRSLQLSESEFHVVRALTEKAFDEKVSNVQGTDSKFLSEERNVRAAVQLFSKDALYVIIAIL